jgi:hypothetical protein
MPAGAEGGSSRFPFERLETLPGTLTSEQRAEQRSEGFEQRADVGGGIRAGVADLRREGLGGGPCRGRAPLAHTCAAQGRPAPRAGPRMARRWVMAAAANSRQAVVRSAPVTARAAEGSTASSSP